MTKICEYCGRSFEPGYNQPDQKYCRRSPGRDCGVKAWREAHPGCEARWAKGQREKDLERARAAVGKYAAKYPEKAKERSRKYYECNKELVSERAKKWWRANPDKTRLINTRNQSRRRAEILGNGGRFTSGEFEKLCVEHNWQCAYCGCGLTAKTVTVDHKIPLSRGGRNDIQNIVPACQSCNSSKHDKTPEEFMAVLELTR